jgi:hypothetical protein
MNEMTCIFCDRWIDSQDQYGIGPSGPAHISCVERLTPEEKAKKLEEIRKR